MTKRTAFLFFSAFSLFSVCFFISISNDGKDSKTTNSESFTGVMEEVGPSQVGSYHEEKVANTPLSSKLIKEAYLNKMASANNEVLSPKGMYEELVRRGVKVDEELAVRMKNNVATPDDWREVSILISAIMSEEESFKVELSQYNNFNDLKRVCEERSKSTGIYYGNELLKHENAYVGASVNDIAEILNNGASLPEDAVLLMARSNNLTLALDLQKKGYAVDVSYIDKYKNQNILEAYVENYSIYDDGKALETIDHLLQLGVALKVDDGTRDPLDYVLTNITPDNAESRFSVAKKLLDAGLTLEDSHNELLNELKISNPEIYKKFVN